MGMWVCTMTAEFEDDNQRILEIIKERMKEEVKNRPSNYYKLRWYEKNRDKILQDKKQWYIENKDKVKERYEYNKIYKQNNKDKISEYNKIYYEKNKPNKKGVHNLIFLEIL